MVDYIAKIKPINADKIKTQAHGIATFSENGNSLHIHVEMFDTPTNIEHWEHFHGFPDGKQAHIPTLMQDVNHDGLLPDDACWKSAQLPWSLECPPLQHHES